MYKGKTLIDLKDKLLEGSNPVEWEAPRLSWPNEKFYKHRYTYCNPIRYKRCLDYAGNLHWESWSCAWCKFNPFAKAKRPPMKYKKKRDPDDKALSDLRKIIEEKN